MAAWEKMVEVVRLLQHVATSPRYCGHVAGLLVLLECALVPAIITRVPCELKMSAHVFR